jgi:two-component system response regulator FlrC
VLIAEDDAALRGLFEDILAGGGYDVVTAEDGREALALLGRGGIDAVLSDVNMPYADGLAVVAAARRLSPSPPVVLVTGFGCITGAVDAMRAGAFDYLTKPVQSPAALRAVLGRALASSPGPAPAPTPGAAGGPSDDFVAADPASVALLELVDRIAARDTTVLLLGESGVGKEVVARRIHQRSPRREGRFVAVNCCAIPRELFEGQMFGHAKGAFSGAQSARIGFFEEAHGGTLLLDEIGELPLELQGKLLRALEERRILRLGETRDVPVDVRVIAATLRDLDGDVRSGRFRQDLYFRLSVFPLEIKPLRQRPGDILPLAESLLARLGTGRRLGESGKRALLSSSWPGNVRELRNVLERAVILAEPSAPGGPPAEIEARHLAVRTETPLGEQRPPWAPSSAAPSGNLGALEKQAVLDAVESTRGNRKAAAAKLGIGLRTLQYKLKQYGLIKR